MNDLKAARALGWASVAIAATEIVGQGTVERDLFGTEDPPQLMYALGARELAAGVAILSQTHVTPTLAASTAVVLGITAIDVIYALRLSKRLADDRRAMARTSPGAKLDRALNDASEVATGF